MKRSRAVHARLMLSTACAMLALPASAQMATAGSGDAAEAMPETFGTIIVTARKREESLQTVPLSVTALSSETIAEQGVDNVRDIVNLTPGLSLSEFGSGTLNVPVVRGLTNLTGSAFAENNVSVFYNGVYIQNSNLIDATFLDVERIEVIKGPVSSLYGRNAYAGVINYVVARPSDSFTADATGMLGTRGRGALEARISGPVAGDTLKASLAARYETSGGSYDDPINGIDFGGFEKLAFQGVLEFEPTDTLNVMATLFYADDRFDQPMRALSTLGSNFIGEGNCGNAPGAFQTTICGKSPDADDSTVSRSSDPAFSLFGNDREMLFGTLEAQLDLGRLQLKSLTSFSDTSYFQRRDQDGTGVGFAFNLVGTPAGTVNLSSYVIQVSDDNSFQQELRATYEATDWLTLTLGGFYNKYEADQDFGFLIDPTPIPAGRDVVNPLVDFLDPQTGAYTTSQITIFEDEELSAFGMVEIDVTPEFSISAEGRWSEQTKLQDQQSQTFKGTFNDPDGPGGIDGSWEFWSYRFSANYQATPDTLLYASVARGNKAGGFNPGSLDPVDLQFDPETNVTYEVGLKTALLGGLGLFDLAVFYADLEDLQLRSITVDGLRTAIRNAGAAKAYGFEASLSAQVTDGVQVGLGLAYANPTFKDGSFINSGQTRRECENIPGCGSRVQTIPGSAIIGTELGGLSLPRQSDWQLNALFSIQRPLTGTLDWTLRGNYAFESKQYSAFPPVNASYVGSRHTANLRGGIATEQYSVELFVDNLTDDGTPLNFGSQFNPSTFQTPLGIVYPDKRTFGIEATVKF